jgi:hypothetical protein
MPFMSLITKATGFADLLAYTELIRTTLNNPEPVIY